MKTLITGLTLLLAALQTFGDGTTVRKATQAEVNAGVNDSAYVTPRTLASATLPAGTWQQVLTNCVVTTNTWTDDTTNSITVADAGYPAANGTYYWSPAIPGYTLRSNMTSISSCTADYPYVQQTTATRWAFRHCAAAVVCGSYTNFGADVTNAYTALDAASRCTTNDIDPAPTVTYGAVHIVSYETNCTYTTNSVVITGSGIEFVNANIIGTGGSIAVDNATGTAASFSAGTTYFDVLTNGVRISGATGALLFPNDWKASVVDYDGVPEYCVRNTVLTNDRARLRIGKAITAYTRGSGGGTITAEGLGQLISGHVDNGTLHGGDGGEGAVLQGYVVGNSYAGIRGRGGAAWVYAGEGDSSFDQGGEGAGSFTKLNGQAVTNDGNAALVISDSANVRNTGGGSLLVASGQGVSGWSENTADSAYLFGGQLTNAAEMSFNVGKQFEGEESTAKFYIGENGIKLKMSDGIASQTGTPSDPQDLATVDWVQDEILASDATRKRNFKALAPADILAKVRQLSIQQYEFSPRLATNHVRTYARQTKTWLETNRVTAVVGNRTVFRDQLRTNAPVFGLTNRVRLRNKEISVPVATNTVVRDITPRPGQHINVTAQDWQAALGLGDPNKPQVHPQDEAAVALLCIQALADRVEALEKELKNR